MNDPPPAPAAGRLAGLHHVQLAIPAGAEDVAEGFYGDLLGLVRVEKPVALAGRGGAWFRAPGGSPEVHLGVEEPFVPARKAHPAFEVHGIDAIADRLASAGVAIVWDDTEIFPGRRRFHAADPFGNRLEFVETEPAADRMA
jgi:catechol 2,3-dioxygenase-like lactoylglutathione lyase family enzyme